MPGSRDDHPSCFMLGLDRRDELAVGERVGGDAAVFFALAQRVVWGVIQPDYVRVDVPSVLRKLESRYAGCFVTHLLVALACRETQPARADDALARARSLCAADDPWRYLLPEPGEWRGERRQPALLEVVEGQMWRVHADFPMTGTPFTTASIATVMRDEAGDLLLANPVCLSDALVEQVRALGTIRVVAAQGRAHSRYVDVARSYFPEARVLGSRGHREHPMSAHVRFDGILCTASGALPAGIEALPVEGTTADEVVLLHHPTRTLVPQDLLANNRSDNDSRGFGSRMYYFAFGLCDRLGMHAYQLLLWNDLAALQRSLGRIAEAPFERVTAAHWPFRPCGEPEVEQLREQLRRLSALTAKQRQRMMWRFMRHQPGFVVDLVRYKRKQAQARKSLATRRGVEPFAAGAR